MKLNWKFLGGVGGGSAKQKTLCGGGGGGVWILSGTAQCELPMLFFLFFIFIFIIFFLVTLACVNYPCYISGYRDL